MEQDFRQRLEAAKRRNTMQLLFKCARLLNERGVALWRSRSGQPNLRNAHTTLLPHIDLEGTRLTTIAERLGISKQAVGQLVSELVDMGALERVPDPSDGRARLIRFSREGRQGLFEGLTVLSELEDHYRERIGGDHMDHLHAALTQLLSALET